VIIAVENVKLKIFMKKITNKTRVRVSAIKLYDYLELTYWNINRYSIMSKYMYDNFDMRVTSKRVGAYYFSVGDKAKYSVFLLKHHDLIQKSNWQ
jgi:hypothetical protein